jgi:hypothetical protein
VRIGEKEEKHIQKRFGLEVMSGVVLRGRRLIYLIFWV